MERNQGMTGGDDVSQGGLGAGTSGPTAGGDGILADVGAVTNALQGGLTSVPLETAAGLVGRIQLALQSSGSAGTQAVATSLGQLQQALTTGQLDGAGALLGRLATQTEEVATQAPGAVGGSLRTLAGLLSGASKQLG
jgi:hypothetical protein